MDEATFQILKSSGFVLSFGLVFATQSLAPYRRVPRLVPGNWRQNVPLALLNTIVMGLACGACLCTAARYAEAHGLGVFRAASLPWGIAAVGTILILDMVLWGWHVANHRLPWLWRFHRVHHSDIDFDISTSLRFHSGELLLSLPLKLAAIVAIGAPVAGVLMFEVVFGLFNMLVHGNIRMSPAWESRLSAVLILPAIHRHHHSIHPDHHNRNFGTILSVWDRLLGTWAGGSSADAVVTGLPGLADSGRLRFWRCLWLPFQSGTAVPGRRNP